MAPRSTAVTPDLPDADAVKRAREGDHEAFRVLVERYQGRAHRLALRILGDPDRARDAVQEGFLKAYGSLAKFQGRSGFYTWFYRLIFNLCIDMKRRDRSGRHVHTLADDCVRTWLLPSSSWGRRLWCLRQIQQPALRRLLFRRSCQQFLNCLNCRVPDRN